MDSVFFSLPFLKFLHPSFSWVICFWEYSVVTSYCHFLLLLPWAGTTNMKAWGKFRKNGCFQKGLERRLFLSSDRFSENRSRNTIKKGLFKNKKQKNRKPIWKFIHFFSVLGMKLRTSRADLPISSQWSLSIPPKNIRKPLVFWCFQDVEKEVWNGFIIISFKHFSYLKNISI